jgi:hypothetical protein
MKKVAIALVPLLFSLAIVAESQEKGISSADLMAVLSRLPSGAPVVYFSRTPQLVPDKDAVVVATGSYSVDATRVRSAKVYFFLKTGDSWTEAFATDEDQRLAEHDAPDFWEISFDRIEYADVDGDHLSEVVIFWNSSPLDGMGFSLIQYDKILNVVDYDGVTGTFREITEDRVVYNEFMDDAFLMNVDSDSQSEIVLWEQIWENAMSVMSPKPYRLSVWEVRSGELVPDPSWNHGTPFETEEEFDLSGCDRVALLRLLLQRASCANQGAQSRLMCRCCP